MTVAPWREKCLAASNPSPKVASVTRMCWPSMRVRGSRTEEEEKSFSYALSKVEAIAGSVGSLGNVGANGAKNSRLH